MVAKISFGNSLFGALAYNGEKINKDEGKLLATNRIFDDGTGKVNIRKALEDFMHFIPDRCRTENPALHSRPMPHGESSGAYLPQSAPRRQTDGHGHGEHCP